MSSIRKDLINIDDMRLDPVTRELVVFDRHIFLRNNEFCLMEFFMKNVGKVLSRTQILEDVWDHLDQVTKIQKLKKFLELIFL